MAEKHKTITDKLSDAIGSQKHGVGPFVHPDSRSFETTVTEQHKGIEKFDQHFKRIGGHKK